MFKAAISTSELDLPTRPLYSAGTGNEFFLSYESNELSGTSIKSELMNKLLGPNIFFIVQRNVTKCVFEKSSNKTNCKEGVKITTHRLDESK